MEVERLPAANAIAGQSATLQEDIDVRNFDSACKSYASFVDAFLEGDSSGARRILAELEPKIAQFKGLPPNTEEEEENGAVCPSHMQSLARDTYELKAMMSVLEANHDEFDRTFERVRPYYTDGSVCAPVSGREYAMVRFNLLRLLLRDRIDDFDAELKSLAEVAESDPDAFMMKVVDSHWEMYDRVFPLHDVANFGLPQTVRAKISELIKGSRGSPVNDGRTMLLDLIQKKLVNYLGKEHPYWHVNEKGWVVSQEAKADLNDHLKVKMDLINQMLSYAMDLEDTRSK